ncbi:ornithine decarboxylase [Phellopilus nigrolimitatus]|nr:ornithine decarboxylase [Phellopilus nigrolimitatus]
MTKAAANTGSRGCGAIDGLLRLFFSTTAIAFDVEHITAHTPHFARNTDLRLLNRDEEQKVIDFDFDVVFDPGPVSSTYGVPPDEEMSRLEVLPANTSIDFDFDKNKIRPEEETFGAVAHSVVNGLMSPVVSRSLHDFHHDGEDEVHFSHLPPLLRGHPEIHLRNGVMRASRLGAVHETDAEKAFFVADLSYVYKQHERWKRCLPGIEPFYAVKCNPDPYVLRLLAALGTGFDCASNNEIARVLELGNVDPSRIIFANPCKALSFIRNAAKGGVDMMTFDNADELYKIARVHPHAKLIVRILTDDSRSLCRLGLKFGAPLVTVSGLLAKARELKLDVIGVSFHVGSGCFDSSAFADAIMRARLAFDMGKEAGYDFTLLDVGGGFEDATFEANASVLSDAIEYYFPDRRSIRIIAEPGRFYVSKAFYLAANIIARRAPITDDTCEPSAVSEDANTPAVMYYINDGVYGSFNCILFDHQIVHPYVLSLSGSFHIPSSEPLRPSSVWGPTCDSIDCVCPVTQLPGNLSVGDWLAFENMGAYTICAASQFNGFEVSNVTYTSGNGVDSAEVRRVLASFAQDAGGGIGRGGA